MSEKSSLEGFPQAFKQNVSDVEKQAGEKEKKETPREMLLKRLADIQAEFTDKKMEKDAEIVSKLTDRIGRFFDYLEEKKKQGLGSHYLSRDENEVLVTSKAGEDGGSVLGHSFVAGIESFDSGSVLKSKKEIEEYMNHWKGHGYKPERMEIVDYKFSDEGETIFYRRMGVLGDNELADDIPRKKIAKYNRDYGHYGNIRVFDTEADSGWQDTSPSHLENIKKEDWDYQANIDTNIEGLALTIMKTPEGIQSGTREEEVTLKFYEEFLSKIFS